MIVRENQAPIFVNLKKEFTLLKRAQVVERSIVLEREKRRVERWGRQQRMYERMDKEQSEARLVWFTVVCWVSIAIWFCYHLLQFGSISRF